ncbi:MAG: G5 domain-containing protein [Chloroflexota bacterium]
MGLYQRAPNAKRALLLIAILILVAISLGGCGILEVTGQEISVSVTADGISQAILVPAGTTAEGAFILAGVSLTSLDKSTPALYSVLQDGNDVVLVRVEEEYQVEQSVVAYETQVLRNESMQEGEQRLIQPGINGLQETTYRIIFEDGIEVSRTISGSLVVTSPTPEIVMVGSQAPFSVVPLPGILGYISAGNAWVMRENTGVRQPVVTSGDLDGRVFEISADGRWLLYTRSSDDEETINQLWVTRIDSPDEDSFDLGVTNIIHFADWVPGTQTGVVYSTAEISPSAPGWEANNDLIFLNFSMETGWTTSPRDSVEENSGGLYGWWGTDFLYSPSGEKLAYSRPDGFGLVDLDYGALRSEYDLLPVQTRSDWAWVSSVAWSPDENFIYFVDHVPQAGLAVGEDSPLFDLAAFPFVGGAPVRLVSEVGMFAFPTASPIRELPSGELSYQVAFLKALSPTQSRTSGYQLVVMDRDGSNQKTLFPTEGGQGMNPNQYFWYPSYAVDQFSALIAVIYQGNIWLVDVDQGIAHQLTGDGLITGIDWR